MRLATADELLRIPAATDALVTEDGACAYRIENGIPLLTPGEIIRLAG